MDAFLWIQLLSQTTYGLVHKSDTGAGPAGQAGESLDSLDTRGSSANGVDTFVCKMPGNLVEVRCLLPVQV